MMIKDLYDCRVVYHQKSRYDKVINAIREGNKTQRELQEILETKQPNVSRLLNDLMQLGIVFELVDDIDARRKSFHVNESAYDAYLRLILNSDREFQQIKIDYAQTNRQIQ